MGSRPAFVKDDGNERREEERRAQSAGSQQWRVTSLPQESDALFSALSPRDCAFDGICQISAIG